MMSPLTVHSALPAEDLLEVLVRSKNDLLSMQSSKILIMGGTGFIGRWLVSSLHEANQTMGLGISIHVGTRDVMRARKLGKLYEHNEIKLHNSSEMQSLSDFQYLVHAATPSNPATGALDGIQVLQNTRQSNANLLEVAKRSTKPSLMHLSSGIVYGESRNLMGRIEETQDRIVEPISHYALAKIETELAIEEATADGIVNGSNPRLFSFFGPLIDMNGHYAIGDFMKMGLTKETIVIKGPSATTRSYLYPTDLVVWLINILVNPSLTATNVGSMHGLTMSEIARTISNLFGTNMHVDDSSTMPATHYVPNCEHTKRMRNLTEEVSFENGLVRWRNWLES